MKTKKLQVFSKRWLTKKSVDLKTGLSIFLFLLFSISILSAQNAPVTFTFSLSSASKTSAGVYKKNGTLVRTLWNNVNYPAGTNKGAWDRRDDAGRLISDTGYVVKLVSNNVQYEWQNVLGNTSDSLIGVSKIHTFKRMCTMAVNNDTAYFGVGYSEGSTSAHKLDFKHPQSKTSIMQDYGTGHEANHVATDGKLVYWAGLDPVNATTSFVYATKVSNDNEAAFTSGSSVGTAWGRTYKSAIDVITSNLNGHPSGIAVQKSGNYLLIAHAKLNELHVLNKTTGALVQTISATAPRELCIDANDNLWMITGTKTVQKYTINGNGTISSAIASIANLVDPLGIAVSPNNFQLLVADGGYSQQVKAYKNSNGDSLWVLGRKGGYETDATVYDDKFYFSDLYTEIRGSFIAFQSDSSFWIGDPGNERVQHFSSNRVFVDRVMNLPHS